MSHYFVVSLPSVSPFICSWYACLTRSKRDEFPEFGKHSFWCKTSNGILQRFVVSGATCCLFSTNRNSGSCFVSCSFLSLKSSSNEKRSVPEFSESGWMSIMYTFKFGERYTSKISKWPLNSNETEMQNLKVESFVQKL